MNGIRSAPSGFSSGGATRYVRIFLLALVLVGAALWTPAHLSDSQTPRGAVASGTAETSARHSPLEVHSLDWQLTTSADEDSARVSQAPIDVPVDGEIDVGSVGTGAFPYGGAYDPNNQLLYIANEAEDNLTVVDATTGQHVTDISFTSDPLGAAFVPSTGLVYVIIEGSKSLAIINPTNNTINSTVKLAGDPEYVAYDPDNDQLYMSVWNSYSSPLGVQTFNVSTGVANPALRVGFDAPYCLAVDPTDNTVWVENLENDSISVIDGQNDTIAGWVNPGPQPASASLSGGIVYAALSDQMFVANYASVGTVNVFSASNRTLVRSGIPVGEEAYGASATYDPASECVYVASYYNDSVTVISVTNDSIAEPTLNVSGGPWVGIYDPTTGALFFLLSTGNGAAWIFGGIAVNFDETGLPSESPWSVTVNDISRSTMNASQTFVEPVGTFPYLLEGNGGYAASVPAGNLTVPATPVSPVTVAVRFGELYPVRFSEAGLPSGSVWSVRFNESLDLATAGAGLDFLELNGSYTYEAQTSAPGFGASLNGSGLATVDGGPEWINVTFAPIPYAVQLNETGLPAGVEWWVNVTGGPSTSAMAASIRFQEANGTYAYRVATTLKTYQAPGGVFTIDGGAYSGTVPFSLVTYPVTFIPTGLPEGASWTVMFGAESRSGMGDLSFSNATNGSYAFSVTPPSGYRATPATGTLEVSGASVTETVRLVVVTSGGTNASGPSTFLGLPADEGYAVLAGLIVVVAAIGVVVLVLRQRGRIPPSPPI